MTTSFNQTLKPGTRIVGRWNCHVYVIEKLLGAGANGRVYLVRYEQQVYAMKLGFDSLDLQSEINALKALARAKTRAAQFFIEADDAVLFTQVVPFYVMQYVEGIQLQAYIAQRGSDWLYPLGLQLLQQLHEIHRKGYIFGDLKRENVLIHRSGRLQLIDYGGVTPKGKAVRQFTELYDRGYWRAGKRTADEAYDLFAFAVICLQSTDPDRGLNSALSPQERTVETLLATLQRCRLFPEVKEILRGIIEERFVDSRKVLEAWRHALSTLDGHSLSDLKFDPLLKRMFIVSAMALVGSIIWVYIA